jgi:hypothetical protein
MQVRAKTLYSSEEYLELETTAKYRSEYCSRFYGRRDLTAKAVAGARRTPLR